MPEVRIGWVMSKAKERSKDHDALEMMKRLEAERAEDVNIYRDGHVLVATTNEEYADELAKHRRRSWEAMRCNTAQRGALRFKQR